MFPSLTNPATPPAARRYLAVKIHILMLRYHISS
jgi:hypothetical protein